MKAIRILWVGKTRTPFIHEGIERYRRLIAPWLTLEAREIREERQASEPDAVREREGRRILNATSRFVLLDAGGRGFSSEEFAPWVSRCRDEGPTDWVIGGAFGVSPEVRGAAEERISLSPMTFTHEMVRLILFEQVYRALTITHGKKYHY